MTLVPSRPGLWAAMVFVLLPAVAQAECVSAACRRQYETFMVAAVAVLVAVVAGLVFLIVWVVRRSKRRRARAAADNQAER